MMMQIRVPRRRRREKKNRQWDQKLKQDCENLDVLNYSKDSAYAISSLKNRRREIKIGYQKASTLTVALIFEQALFTRFFFQALSFTKKCQLKQNNNSIPRMNLLSVLFVVVEPSWLFLVNHQKYRESGNSEILNHAEGWTRTLRTVISVTCHILVEVGRYTCKYSFYSIYLLTTTICFRFNF